MQDLLQVLEQEEDGPSRGAALHSLGALETMPVGPLTAIALQDRDPVIRLGALQLLVRRATAEPQVRVLVEQAATADPDQAVRENATALLEVFGQGEMDTR